MHDCYDKHVHAGSAFQEQERLCVLEKRYLTLTGGRNFPKPNSSMKEVSRIAGHIISQPEAKQTKQKKKQNKFPPKWNFSVIR